jgi:cadmium resistance protein CadD (predicted permease)
MNYGIVIAVAILTFLLTNIDDFAVLILFFSKCKIQGQNFRAVDVVVGQTVAFTIICAVSLVGIVLGSFIAPEYVKLVGFLPIIIALKMFREQYLESRQVQQIHSETEPNRNELHTSIDASKEYRELEMNSKINDDLENSPRENDNAIANNLIHDDLDNVPQENDNPLIDNVHELEKLEAEEKEHEYFLIKEISKVLAQCLRPQMIEVCTITLANSGDNVSIYLPIFASASSIEIIITVVVFFAMLALLLVSTFFMVDFKFVSDFFEKYGSIIVPWFLIGLAFYILTGSIIFKNTPLFSG